MGGALKTCKRCDETRPLEDFPPRNRKHARDGRYSYCRPCSRILSAERQAAWRKRNPEKARAKSRESSRKLRAERPDYFRNWYWANVEKERKRCRALARRYRAKYPDRIKEQQARFRALHPERIRKWERENTNRRRALMRTSSPETAQYMADLLQQPCAYCAATETITVDHVVPLSRGGKHEPANLAPACLSCNSSKGAKLLEEWLSTTSPE